MDKVQSRSSSVDNTNYEINTSYETSSTEPVEQRREPVACCPDGSEVYETDVCAATGLKGPPTASERYLSSLAEEPSSSTQTPAARDTDQSSANEGSRKAEKEAVSKTLEAARGAVLNAIRQELAKMSLKVGDRVSRNVDLPNGFKLKCTVEVALEKTGNGSPELVTKVSGSIEGALGGVSGSMRLAYAHFMNGQEAASFEACVFGGIDQKVGAMADIKLKAGVCATYTDATSSPAQLQIDGVARAEANFHLVQSVDWSRRTEARYPISNEVVPFDVVR